MFQKTILHPGTCSSSKLSQRFKKKKRKKHMKSEGKMVQEIGEELGEGVWYDQNVLYVCMEFLT